MFTVNTCPQLSLSHTVGGLSLSWCEQGYKQTTDGARDSKEYNNNDNNTEAASHKSAIPPEKNIFNIKTSCL